MPEQREETGRCLPVAQTDPAIRHLIDTWQTVLHNIIAGNGVSAAEATSTMLAVAAYWRGEAVGNDRAALELQQYADHQQDEHLRAMTSLRADAEGSSRH